MSKIVQLAESLNLLSAKLEWLDKWDHEGANRAGYFRTYRTFSEIFQNKSRRRRRRRQTAHLELLRIFIDIPFAMLSTARSRAIRHIPRTVQLSARRTYAFSANDQQEINDPNSPKKVPNVSRTNETPIENPFQDAPLQENVKDAEEKRVAQAPNRATVWSRSQKPREKAMSGPRFEQTIMELQVL